MSEIVWSTIESYMFASNETPIPMPNSNGSCVLVVKPRVGLELRFVGLTEQNASGIRIPATQNFEFGHYETVSGWIYFIKVVKEAVYPATLDFFNTVVRLYSIDKLSPQKAFNTAYAEYLDLLRRTTQVTDELVRGLWGELFVIDSLVSMGVSAESVVNCWTGPFNVNDFAFSNISIEVKTSLRPDNTVTMSSMDQLDTERAWIILLKIRESPKEDGGFSVAELIERINHKIPRDVAPTFKNLLEQVLPNPNQESIRSNLYMLKQSPIVVSIPTDDLVLRQSRLARAFSAAKVSKVRSLKYQFDLSSLIPPTETPIATPFQELLQVTS